MLDKTKKFSEAGYNDHGIKYVQDGKNYGVDGNEIVVPVAPVVRSVESLEAEIAMLNEEIESLRNSKPVHEKKPRMTRAK